ncbi:MFS transporter [Aquibacillus saliphilus]|uniref:MFS transporter n=1 Tax=Aquibacillus saliphilus TaxID=1909422 RepID=UPI001CF04DE2|nr:glycoside-pentoside-hexuronide (GPH):cation symporter [Aquibacillus saliphilus]
MAELQSAISNVETAAKRPFGVRDKLGYMFGNFGNDFTFQLASIYLMVFYTKVFGLSAGIVGTLFLVARSLDAFTDIGVGTIVDRLKGGKKGKFLPWIKYLAIPIGIASIFMYNIFIVDWSYATKVIYAFITYLIWGSVFYTAINIPYGSMAAVISQKAEDRASLSTFRTIGSLITGLFVGVVVPLFIYSTDSTGNSIVDGNNFFMVAVLFGIVGTISYFACYKLCTERVTITKEQEQKNIDSKVLVDLKELFKDRAFVIVVVNTLFALIASLVTGTLNQYIFLDYFGNTALLPLVSLTQIVGMIAMAPLARIITKRFGKKEAGTVGLIICGVIFILTVLVGQGYPWLFIILRVLASFGLGYYTMVSWAFITDVIDSFLIKTGKRKDGTVYSVYSFTRKLGQALAGGIGGWALAWIGYDSLATVQTESVQNGIFLVSNLLPGILYIAGAVLLFTLYPLSKAKVKENEAIIEAMQK